jgi:hypothetical protein
MSLTCANTTQIAIFDDKNNEESSQLQKLRHQENQEINSVI